MMFFFPFAILTTMISSLGNFPFVENSSIFSGNSRWICSFNAPIVVVMTSLTLLTVYIITSVKYKMHYFSHPKILRRFS